MSEWQFCPFCGDDLDTGWECNGCGQDWMEYAFPWQCRSDFRPVWYRLSLQKVIEVTKQEK